MPAKVGQIMVQKYIIDTNYQICQGCRENYILKNNYQCYECELGTAIHEMQYFAKCAEDLANNPMPLIKERPMKPNMRHPGNHHG